MKKLLAMMLALVMLLSCACAEGFLPEGKTLAADVNVDVNKDQMNALLNIVFAMQGQSVNEQVAPVLNGLINLLDGMGGKWRISNEGASGAVTLNDAELATVYADARDNLNLSCSLLPGYVAYVDVNAVLAMLQQLIAATGVDVNSLMNVDMESLIMPYVMMFAQYMNTVGQSMSECNMQIMGKTYTQKITLSLNAKDTAELIVAMMNRFKQDLNDLGLGMLAQKIEVPDASTASADDVLYIDLYVNMADESVCIPVGNNGALVIAQNGFEFTIDNRYEIVKISFVQENGKVTLSMDVSTNWGDENGSFVCVIDDKKLTFDMQMINSREGVNLTMSVVADLRNDGMDVVEVMNVNGITVKEDSALRATDDGLNAVSKLYVLDMENELITVNENVYLTDEAIVFPDYTGYTRLDVLKLITGEDDIREVETALQGALQMLPVLLLQRVFTAAPNEAALLLQLMYTAAPTVEAVEQPLMY